MAMANRVQDCETPDNSPSKHLSWTPFAVAMGRTFTSLLLLDNFLSHILSFLPVNLAPGDYKSVNHLEKHSRHPCDRVFCSFVGHLDFLKPTVWSFGMLYCMLWQKTQIKQQEHVKGLFILQSKITECMLIKLGHHIHLRNSWDLYGLLFEKSFSLRGSFVWLIKLNVC